MFFLLVAVLGPQLLVFMVDEGFHEAAKIVSIPGANPFGKGTLLHAGNRNRFFDKS